MTMRKCVLSKTELQALFGRENDRVNEYYVYILRCRDGSFYTGVTNDYLHRVWQHQEEIDEHCYTFKRRLVKLVYVGIFGDINEAISWEKKVKRWSRAKKEALIRRNEAALKKYSKRRGGRPLQRKP